MHLKRDRLKIADSTIWDLLTCSSVQCEDCLVQKSSTHHQWQNSKTNNLAMCGTDALVDRATDHFEHIDEHDSIMVNIVFNCPLICFKTKSDTI